jgi:hypothetical protein
VELEQYRRREMESYTIADAQTLNTIKNRLRDVTRALDACWKVYPETLEASQVKHEVVVLLTELHLHGLLPDQVTISQGTMQNRDEQRRKA